jgi:RNA polymerase-binding protein DksA
VARRRWPKCGRDLPDRVRIDDDRRLFMTRRGPLAQRTVDRLARQLRERRRCASEVAEAFRAEGEEANATADMSDRLDSVSPIPAASEESFMLAERAEEMVLAIDRALERIAAGVYGHCEHCGDPIPLQRLEAVPTASSCVSCKQDTIARVVARAHGPG